MKDKQLRLLESGVKLFAERGYYQTSIQEIAANAGISKGGFYLYFQSKEDFLAIAIEHFSEEIFRRIESVKKENVSSRHCFAKQITVLTQYILKYKDFIFMHLRENISIGKDTDQLIRQMQLQNFHWLRENIQAIYGEQVNPYLVDMVIQLEGLLHGYFKHIVVDQQQVDANKIGSFLVRRLDDIVRGMMEKNEEPLISWSDLPALYAASLSQQTGQQQLSDILFAMKEKISELNEQKSDNAHLQTVADELLEEASKQEPKYIVIQGLLAHFSGVPELKEECEQVAKLLNLNLLQEQGNFRRDLQR